MSNTLSRAKTLAHIASIASKSKIEDSDVLFFKDGIYKGEWNPNTVANNLPANTQQNDIFLVSDTGSYYGRTLLIGDLVRFVCQDKPILVYSKYLPIPFFLSMLDEPQQAGAGFVYGGSYSAVPTSTDIDATFNVLQFCTDTGSALTPINSSPYGALVTNLSDSDAGTTRNFRFTCPDTTNNKAFAIGFTVNNTDEPAVIVNDTESSFLGIGSMSGSPILLTKLGQSINTIPLTNMGVGDVIVLQYRPAIQTVYVINETQGNSPVTTITLSNYPEFTDASISLLVFSSVASGIAYTFNDTGGYPLQRELLDFHIPSDLEKTYYVDAHNFKSKINGEQVKTGDFVNFFDDNGTTKVAITRLVSDEYIRTVTENIATTAINTQLATDGSGSIYNAIQTAINP